MNRSESSRQPSERRSPRVTLLVILVLAGTAMSTFGWRDGRPRAAAERACVAVEFRAERPEIVRDTADEPTACVPSIPTDRPRALTPWRLPFGPARAPDRS